MAINTHACQVHKSKNSKSGDPPFGARRVITLKKGQQKPQQANQPESQYSQNLPVDEPHLGWDELERLEHEEEVPLRLDSRRGRSKKICLNPKLPREDCCQPAQHAQCHVPSYQFAQQEVG